MERIEKNLSDITRTDWVAFHWAEREEFGQNDRVFMRVARRAPDEAAQAAEDWDSTADERGFEIDQG